MTIEYLNDTGYPRVEHLEASEVRSWAVEHLLVVIVHAVPERSSVG